MRRIVGAHFPDISDKLAKISIEAFYRLRQIRGIEKRPATRELLHWIRAMISDPDFHIKDLKSGVSAPLLGLLFKKSDDMSRAQKTVAGGMKP